MATIDQLDVFDLECVVMLAETLNFMETARRLHMTQPGLTARINKVEKYRGYKLFDRSKGVVRSITPEGFVFVEEAKRVLENILRLITRSDEAHRAFSERISVSRPRHVDLQLLSVVVAAQAVEGMRISFQQPCDSDEEAISMLLNGKADVAMVAWPVTEPYVAPLHLTHDTLLAVLPENHVLRDRAEIHIADLRHEQIIGSKGQFPRPVKDILTAKCKELAAACWAFEQQRLMQAVCKVDCRRRNLVGQVTDLGKSLKRLSRTIEHLSPPRGLVARGIQCGRFNSRSNFLPL
jgi:DNA-binding transcriptional LysR family regulator